MIKLSFQWHHCRQRTAVAGARLLKAPFKYDEQVKAQDHD
jgi:hypothetical protein